MANVTGVEIAPADLEVLDLAYIEEMMQAAPVRGALPNSLSSIVSRVAGVLAVMRPISLLRKTQPRTVNVPRSRRMPEPTASAPRAS